MPKRNKKSAGAENTEPGVHPENAAGPTSAKEFSRRSEVPIQVTLRDEETNLPAAADQPLMSRESGESWDYQADPQVLQVLRETERLDGGVNELTESLRLHNAESPILSGGDVDAAWENGEEGGEETVGGSAPTPDQDRVGELGEAAGLVYQDEEPLNTRHKLEKRDRDRWELNPASQD